MPKMFHGEPLTIDQNEDPTANAAPPPEPAPDAAPANEDHAADAAPPPEPAPAAAGAAAAQHWPFNYLFGGLAQDQTKLLPTEPETAQKLRELGPLMKEPKLSSTGAPTPQDPTATAVIGVPIPTIYTFFGQFVDHDITLTTFKDNVDLSKQDLAPLPYSQITDTSLVWNSRTPNFDLDSVYGSDPNEPFPPKDPASKKLLLGRVEWVESLPEDRKGDPFQDLYRGEPGQTPRVALIGDRRNDDNLILAQLHVAFVRAHNVLIDRGYEFDEARTLLIQHYQWIVLEDFLHRVVDPVILKKARQQPNYFKPGSRAELFIPLEFSAAAYRFGHSKVRPFYPFEKVPGGSAQLSDLFDFTNFSGGAVFTLQIPGFWVVQWKDFLNSTDQRFFSRPIDTLLTPDLLNLPREDGADLQQQDWRKNLAIRNLLRGYLLRLPTGQAVAEAMNQRDNSIVPLTGDQIKSAVTEPQYDLLKQANFLDQTPLWFYILAEAAYYNKGHHLGPVGSTIVAETIIGILRYSDYSILSNPYWRPTLGLTSGKFDLEDLLILAGVYDPQASS